MRGIIKYLLFGLGIVLLTWFSLDIEDLEEFRARATSPDFNAEEYARSFWENDLPKAIAEAVPVSVLMESLRTDPLSAFASYGKKLGISQTGYFFLIGEGIIERIEEDYLVVRTYTNEVIHLALGFIYGNAVRDGSGRVDISDFVNMTDFNNTSVAINRIIKDEIIPGLARGAETGGEIKFVGAAEIHETALLSRALLVIPVKIEMVDGG